jgi:hypothetical protein
MQDVAKSSSLASLEPLLIPVVAAKETQDRTVNRGPNKVLTEEEKNDKKRLTRLLKLQIKIRKYETRLSQSILRRNHDLEARTRRDLHAVLQQAQERNFNYNAEKENKVFPGQAAARDWVESIYHRLRQQMMIMTDAGKNAADEVSCGSSHISKEYRNEQARQLLQNMTKGTQTLTMFDNAAALLGYTRHKFIERAMLVVDSLGKLIVDLNLDESAASVNNGYEETAHHAASQWVKRFESVRCVCSLGSGPGCDVVGVVSFLRSMNMMSPKMNSTELNNDDGYCDPDSQGNDTRTISSCARVLDQAILLDWAMEQWRSIVLEPLQTLLVPESIGSMHMATCDIGYALYDSATNSKNEQAKRMIPSCYHNDGSSSSRDLLVVISYLLSETRGKWHHLLDDLMPHPRTGMVLILDPTAWQIHFFCHRYRNLFDYTWLDSSMHHPQLQPLEGRVGPAAVLGVRKGE